LCLRGLLLTGEGQREKEKGKKEREGVERRRGGKKREGKNDLTHPQSQIPGYATGRDG